MNAVEPDNRVGKMADLADGATNVIDNLTPVDNFTWSHKILMEALLSEESNRQYVDIDDPDDVLKILCGSKAERKRMNGNNFWVWFDYRDQRIFSRKITATKHSDLVGLTEGNDFFRSNVAALAFVHGQLKVRENHKL